jgi:aquaporin Z
VVAQVLGGIAAAGLLYLIATGKAGMTVEMLRSTGFAANGFGDTVGSPGNYSPLAAFVAEVVMTFFFLIVIMGATHGRAPKGFAPLAIGLCLTLIHLVTIPITNTSVNPARSTGPALFVQGWAIAQLWMFWVAPILGAMLAGFFYSWLAGDDQVPPQEPVVGEAATTTVVEVIEN